MLISSPSLYDGAANINLTFEGMQSAGHLARHAGLWGGSVEWNAALWNGSVEWNAGLWDGSVEWNAGTVGWECGWNTDCPA